MEGLLQRIPQHVYAWIIVAVSSLMMGMAFGSLISVSVFLKPLEAEFGWDRGVTSFAYSCAAFMTGLTGIGMGRLVDRVSPRPLLIVGALSMGGGLLLLSRIDALWQLYLLYGLMVGGLGGGSFLIPLITNVGFWFERHKGVAIGTVMAGQSLGGAVMPTVARLLLAQFDWRGAYVALGLIALALLLPLSLLIRSAPGLAAMRVAHSSIVVPSGGLSPARVTATLCAAIVCCCVCMAIPVVHAYPLAVESGLSAVQAASVLGVLMATSIIGRIGIGRIADHVGGIRSLLLASAIQTAMTYWFSQTAALPALLIIAVLFGIGYGGVIPSYAIIIRELIPPRTMGQSLGYVFFFGNLGMSLGGYLGGLLYDLSGGYPTAFGAGAAAGVLNLVIVSTLLIRTRLHRAAAPAAA